MRGTQLSAPQTGGDNRVQRGAVDHGLRDRGGDSGGARHSRLREMGRHADSDRIGHRALDIAGVQQSDGRDAHRRAVGIAPKPGRARVLARFQRVDAAACAGPDVGRVIAIDAVVPSDDSLHCRLQRDCAGVDDGLGDGEGLLGVIGDAPGRQTGMHDMVVRRALPAIQPAESALGIVRVDLRRHSEGIAQGLAVESAEDFVLHTVRFPSDRLSCIFVAQ